MEYVVPAIELGESLYAAYELHGALEEGADFLRQKTGLDLKKYKSDTTGRLDFLRGSGLAYVPHKRMPKRRYGESMKGSVLAKRARYTPVPGYQRVSGFYGRFQHEKGKMIENKFFDTALDFTFDLTAIVPATGQLCLVPQGTTESTRIGRKLKIHSIQIRGVYSCDQGAQPLSINTYLYLMQDTQTNGAAATLAEMFTGNDLSSAMINLANSGRFRVLKRFLWTSTPSYGTIGAPGDSAGIMEDYYKKMNLEVDFSSTTGALTEIRSNNLFLVAGAKNGDNLVTFHGTCRIRYSD